MTAARIYGRTHDWASQSVVTRGVAAGLQARGLLAGVVELHRDYEAEDEVIVPGATARAGVFTGPPALVSRLAYSGQHARRLAFLVPNSNSVPLPLLRSFATLTTDILTPSKWARAMLLQAFAQALPPAVPVPPVHVVPHGVVSVAAHEESTAGLERLRLAVPGVEARRVWLHWSTSAHQRKGTRELLEAWALLAERGRLDGRVLVCVLDPDARSAVAGLLLRLRRGQQVSAHLRLVDRGFGRIYGLAPAEMRPVLRAVGGVIQPSRGEGFGIVPLEARAAGCIAVATACTGHSEHMPEGVCTVPSGELTALDDGPEALAPSVPVEGLVATLERVFAAEDALRAEHVRLAPEVEANWAWTEQTAGLCRLIEETKE